MKIKKITNLIFEAFQLKRIKHEWWRVAWVENPDSVAEHSLIAAQIAFYLAKMELADPYKTSAMLIFHDLPESRIWDLHKIACRYIDWKKEIEEKIFQDQFDWISFSEEIIELFLDYEEGRTLEWKIAKDADYLEQSFQAKIYLEIWYKETQDWIDNVWENLKTESAKKIWEEMCKTWFNDWWKKWGLKKLK